MIKSKTSKLTILLLTIACVVAVSIAAVTVIDNNAQAEEKANTQNGQFTSTISVEPSDVPEEVCKIKQNPIPEGKEIEYFYYNKMPGIGLTTYQINYEQGSTNRFSIEVYNKGLEDFGYEFQGVYVNGVTPTDLSTWSCDINVEVKFKKIPNTYGFAIKDNEGEPVLDYHLGLYDNDHNLVASGVTSGERAVWEFESYEDYRGYAVLGYKEGYTDIVYGIPFVAPQPQNKNWPHLTVAKLGSENFSLDSDSASHDYFKIEVQEYNRDGDFYAHLNSFCESCNVYYNDPFIHCTVEADGTIQLISPNPSTSYTAEYNVTPIAKDDAWLDHWVADFGEGYTRDLKPGDDFDLPGDAAHTFLKAVYESSAPTPTEEVVADSAQTGDSTAALPLAILAVASAVVLITRKRWLSK